MLRTKTSSGGERRIADDYEPRLITHYVDDFIRGADSDDDPPSSTPEDSGSSEDPPELGRHPFLDYFDDLREAMGRDPETGEGGIIETIIDGVRDAVPTVDTAPDEDSGSSEDPAAGNEGESEGESGPPWLVFAGVAAVLGVGGWALARGA